MTIRALACSSVLALAITAPSVAGATMPVAPAAGAPDREIVLQVAKPMEPAPRKKRRAYVRSELDRSLDQGTVPARFRRDVPPEYQRYIPFENDWRR